MFAKILLAVMGLGIITFLGCNFSKKNNSSENNTNELSNDLSKNQPNDPPKNPPVDLSKDLPTDLPIIKAYKEINELEKQDVYVLGTYKLADMRMRRENPAELFLGHAEIVFEDGHSVVLMPPDDKLAIRSEEEQTRCNGKMVYAKGTLYPYIPRGESNLKSPCLVDIEFIKLVE